MTPYYLSRTDAGIELAKNLKDLRYEDTVVLAVNEGAVVVAAQIAAELHSLLTLILTKSIHLPDQHTIIGLVNEKGGFVRNSSIPLGTLTDLMQEYRNTIELSKLQALRDMHEVVGSGGLVEKRYFRHRTVIVVSDGVRYGNTFHAVMSYLHDINTNDVILVTPVAAVEAIDRMHVMADRIEIGRVVPMYFDTNHYYEENQIPSSEEIYNYLNNIVMHWNNIELKGVSE